MRPSARCAWCVQTHQTHISSLLMWEIHTNKGYQPNLPSYIKHIRFCNKYSHIEDKCKRYKQHLHEMKEKAKKMNLAINKKPTYSFCKLKGHTIQQCHCELQAEYQPLNSIKPKPKEHLVSMTSDGEDGVETNKIINRGASGNSVPDLVKEDS